jgi:hypothetical protein
MATIGTVRLLDVRYTIEDDGHGGSMPVYSEWDNGPVPYSDETVQCETVEEAARAIIEHGCTQDGGRWYADPDGSHPVSWATAERSERSAHPDGFTAEQLDQIGALVRNA